MRTLAWWRRGGSGPGRGVNLRTPLGGKWGFPGASLVGFVVGREKVRVRILQTFGQREKENKKIKRGEI